MKPHQTFGEIKAYARGALAGHYGVAIMTLIDEIGRASCRERVFAGV